MSSSNVVLLCQIELATGQARFVESLGYTLVSASSVARAERLLDAGGVRYVVISLATGGGGPERIAKRARAAGTEIFCAAPRLTHSMHVRAQNLGVESLYVWPEGIVGRLVERAPERLSVSVRIAERLLLEHAGLGVALQRGDGRLLNVSATGALLESPSRLGDERLDFALELPGLTERITVRAEVVRQELIQGSWRVGVRFVDISPETTELVRAFVRRCNVVDVRPNVQAPGLKVKARVRDGRRVDYFRLEQLEGQRAVLLPKSDFLPPYRVGVVLLLSALQRSSAGPYEAVVREALELAGPINAPHLAWGINLDERGASEFAGMLSERE